MKFMIFGYGRMGKKVESVLNQEGEEITAIVDPPQGYGYRTEPWQNADTAICFTDPEAGELTTEEILTLGVDAVVGTTSFYLLEDGSVDLEMLGKFEEIAKRNNCRMVYAANFSLGMQAFQKIVSAATQMLWDLYDVGISEEHHTKKKDVSGTAKEIARLIIYESPYKDSMNINEFDRQREPGEITISVNRVGNIPGTHSVTYDSKVDTVKLTHCVRDPNIFAYGALNAAYRLRSLPAGVYSVDEIL